MIPGEHFEFLHAIWARRTPFTYVFLAVNISIFLLMAFAGGTTDVLMAFGMKSNAEIDQGRQIWRFVTPIFIHIGLLHLFFNSYALWIVGPQVEKLYGSATYVILYVLTGIAGVAGSYIYHPYTPSAGASGAIFGLFGVLLVFGIRYRKSVPPAFKKAVGAGVLPVIVINLIIGFTIPAIDNSAHISGLLAGGVLAAVLPFQRPGARTPRVLTNIQLGILAVVVISFFEVAANYNGPRLLVRNLPRGITLLGPTNSSAQEFIDAINNARNAFEHSSSELEGNNIANVPQVQLEVAKSVDQLRNIPSLAAGADALSAGLLMLMQDQYDLIQDVQRAGTITFSHSQRLRRNMTRYEDLMESFSKWVETDGAKYGIGGSKGR